VILHIPEPILWVAGALVSFIALRFIWRIFWIVLFILEAGGGWEQWKKKK
jgi:hypothetical protein